MLCKKFLFVLAVISCLVPVQSIFTLAVLGLKSKQSEQPVKPEQPKQFKPIKPTLECSHFGTFYYATDGTYCYLFRNTCLLQVDDLVRISRKIPRLSMTTKEACQAQCPQNCGTEIKPVCGEHSGLYKTFNNYCELLKKACNDLMPIMKAHDGKCDLYLNRFVH